MRILFASCLLVLGAALGAQTTMGIRVDARCVDPQGDPVPSVTLADRWSEVDGHWQWSFECPTPDHPLTLISDQDGRVRGTWVLSPFATPLLAWSADHALAAFVAPSFDPLTHEGVVVGDLRMQRTTEVHAEIRSLSASPACRFGLIWKARDAEGNERSMHCFLGLDRRMVDVALPPGTYELSVGIGFGVAPSRSLVIEQDRTSLDLGTIAVPSCAFDLPGEVLPDWHVDHARNIALEDATLAHFRGKPLLVSFADYGNPPHLDQADRERLGALAAHPQRDRFAVVLFGPTRDLLAGLPPRPPNPEFDKLFPPPKPPQPPVESMFPLLGDDTAATERLYGCAWGAIVLDRDGRLLMHGSLADAITRLEKEITVVGRDATGR